jgi:hypothetical protein
MSDQQMEELYERLVAGKKKETNADYPFNRGWNAGIEFAMKQQRIVCEEVDNMEKLKC